jgi:PHD/YefM family antitoxin component YafN of YafNO toxin-antitoxin module
MLVPTQALAVEKGTYIEQEVVIERVEGQSAQSLLQKTWFTDKHIRSENINGDQRSVAIMDLAKKTIVLIPSDEKQYIEMKLSDYQRAVAMRLSGVKLNESDVKPKLTKTSESKKIGKWQCDKYSFEQKGAMEIEMEMWVSKDTGVDPKAYLNLIEQMGLEKTLGRLFEHVAAIDGVPIESKITQTQDDQTIVSSSKIKKIEIGPIDPALFKVPPGYKKMEADSLFSTQ